jgi:TolB-like protein/tetratricopeptide (TPR) repeat protein
VRGIADALAAAGYEVWWDTLIEGGAAFAREIEAQLEVAEAVIAIWSALSVGSDWVRDEAAHGRDRKRLLPVSLDGIEPPLGFRQYHAVDLSRWNGRPDAPEMEALLRNLASIVNEAAPGAPVFHPTPPPPSRRVTRRSAIIAGGGLIVAAGAGGLFLARPWQKTDRNTVAVLPFVNLSGDPAQAYFSDGLSEEVRSALARNTRLRVAGPTSTNSVRDRTQDVRQIADQLGVAFVLEGSVRKAGDVVRIVAELIDGSTGFTSWSQTFDRKLDDIFALQGQIADTVAGVLAAKVTPGSLSPGGTTNSAAYDAYLRGLSLFNADAGEASDRGALAKFDEAIAADPRYAAALAARSRALAGIAGQYAKAAELHSLYDEAVAAAEQAVELAPDLAAAHAALGFATFTGLLDFKAARAPYDRAYALGGGDADILVLFAFFAAKTGRGDEALAAIRRAETLDPLNPRTFRAEGSILIAARRYAQAIAPARHALTMNPKLSTAHSTIGVAQYSLGDTAGARATFDAEPNGSLRLAGLAICDHRLGNTAAAKAEYDKLVSDFGDSAVYQQAQILAQWGQRDAAIAALDRARAVTDAGITAINYDPMLDPLRADRRFINLLGALGLR